MRCFSLLVALALTACHSGGEYGFSRTYQPLSAESSAADEARQYDPVMATRDKQDWKKTPISVFGVVLTRTQAKDGSADLKLSMRTLSKRNLCDDFDEETCRVTVSEREYAVVHALVKLASSDELGEHSVGRGSLIRVIGKLTDDVDLHDGTPIIRATYYRHWPRNFFVTTADASHMQR